MNISGIGIQQISSRTGTGEQGPNPTPDPNNDTDTDGAKTKPTLAPPSPGTGRLVDKTA